MRRRRFVSSNGSDAGSMISFNSLISILALITALGCGTIAGVFFAFSTFVMKALARLPANEGIAAMQSINVAAVNSWFWGLSLERPLHVSWLSLRHSVDGAILPPYSYSWGQWLIWPAASW